MLDFLLIVFGVFLVITGIPLVLRNHILSLYYPYPKTGSLGMVLALWPGLFLDRNHKGKWFFKSPKDKIIIITWKHRIIGLLFLTIGGFLIYAAYSTNIDASLIIR